MNRFHEQDYYEILEVPATAAQHEVHRAYQRAKATYAQDNPALYSMFSREEAQQVMKLIDEAYTVLGNPTLRAAYDERRQAYLLQSPSSPASVPRPTDLTHSTPSTPDALPDFVIPEADMTPWQESPSPVDLSFTPGMARPSPVQTSPPTASVVPEGHGRTRYSVYPLDEEFEKMLSHLQSFDGEILRKVRRYKNLTLEQIASSTNIGLQYLESLENNDYVALPAAVFVRGFVSQYAKILGLDERRVANSYMQLYKESRGT